MPVARLTHTAAHGRRAVPSGASTHVGTRTRPPCQASAERRGSRLKRSMTSDGTGGIDALLNGSLTRRQAEAIPERARDSDFQGPTSL